MLNIISYRTTIVSLWIVLLATTACSLWQDDLEPLEQSTQTEMELPDGHNIAIMAASGATTRTTIDPSDMQSVMWASDDQIALWAMEEGSSVFSLEAATLSLYYYSSEYSSAIFTGNVIELAEGTYTYLATYPPPTSVSDTSVTLSLPSVQSGYYDGVADLMFGRADGQAALSDDALRNGSLAFEQLTHAIRIEIPEERDLLGSTTKLQITFPQAVVGDATINITDENPAITLSNTSNSIYVDFDQVISSVDYVWLFIAPTTMEGEIQFLGYDKDNVPSQTITTTLTQREMAAGHITPITLTIPEEDYRSVVLNVVENNLGEQVTSATLTAPSGALFEGDLSQITLYPNEDGNFEFSYSAALYDTPFRAGGISVSYESPSAIVEGAPITLTEEQKYLVNYVDCSIPYLFEEDFALVASNSGDADGTVTVDGYDIWTIGSHYQYWQYTSVAIKAYNSSWSSSFTNSSLVLSSISAIKEGVSLDLDITFDAGWTKNTCGGMNLVAGDSTVTLSEDSSVAYDNLVESYSTSASEVDNSTSIKWTTSAQSASFFGSGHEVVYIDNIKISIK